MRKIKVIIPAFNEENAVGRVVQDIPSDLVDEVVVVNNNSTDETSRKALEAGATVLFEEIKGYGRACLTGLDYLNGKMKGEDIVVFLDADYSDHPEQMPLLIEPILKGESKMVIGSRKLGKSESGSMTFPQRFGNWLACSLINLIYHVKFTDLGPFRAIEYGTLMSMQMQDLTYGWTVEMQVKAAKMHIPSTEVQMDYRKRIGFSKISGTVKGTILAGYKIITTIFKFAFK